MLKKLKDFKKYITLKNIIIALTCLFIVATSVTLCLVFDKEPEAPETTPVISEKAEPIYEPPKPIVISSPEADDTTTTEPTYMLSGTCDPRFPLKMNGEVIEFGPDGAFSLKVDLKIGANTFTFEQKDTTVTKTVRYRYVLIGGFEPKGDKTYSSGSVLSVSVAARVGSTVTATLNGQTVECKRADAQNDNDTASSDTFVNYTGTFQLPSGNKENLNLGKITFKATLGDIADTASSGKITVKKSSIIKDSDPSVTPSGANYIDVGSGLIATVTADYAETFNGRTSDDYSNPAYNYLPKGTQDYCAEGVVVNGKKNYLKLRCGRRIYTETNSGYDYSKTVATTAIGKLPDHNELSVLDFETDEKYSFLTLKSNWKAPFYFELKNQSYRKTSYGYTMDSVTFSYLDITFCYATVFDGAPEIPADHPIFSSAEVIKNESDYTLRLRLKKTGGFYGWDCYYDNSGDLVFRFLNPAKMENDSSLNGITVYIDVGHGGKDGGAGANYSPYYNEAACNLILAKKIEARLKNLGANVIMNRTDNSTLINPPERMQGLKNSVADYCVAIHHDSSGSASPHGFRAAYFTPYSKTAAEFIATRTENTGLYNKMWPTESHYYYVSRITTCPTVLTENGFMSNRNDYNNIINDESSDKKADAIVDGILDYFRSIQ